MLPGNSNLSDLLSKFKDDLWTSGLNKLHDATLVGVQFALDRASLVLTFETLVSVDNVECESSVIFEFDSVYNFNVTGNLRNFWLLDAGEQPSTSLVFLFEAHLTILSNKDLPGALEATCIEFVVEGLYGWHIRFVAQDFRRTVRNVSLP